MTYERLLDQLENSPVAKLMQIGDQTWVIVNTVHVLSFTFMVGSVLMVDLRLLGISARERSVTQMSRDVLPWTWGAFSIACVTGLLLFAYRASFYGQNTPMQSKMLAMMLAGANMALFHFWIWRSVADWDTARPPAAAKVAGALSLLLWVAVVALGRWTAFVGYHEQPSLHLGRSGADCGSASKRDPTRTASRELICRLKFTHGRGPYRCLL